MEVKIDKPAKFQVELKIELPAEEFNRFFDRAVSNLGRDLEIQGFRKGKVPKFLVEEKIGREKVLAEAAEMAVRESYQKAVLENKIEPISQPEIKIQKIAPNNSFLFSARINVLPEIDLPDYKKIASKVERKKTSVEEKEIESALTWLQKSRAKFSQKKGLAQKGDFVEIEYFSSQIKSLGPSKKDAFILGEGRLIPGFEEKLIGMEAGQNKEFSLTLPKEHLLKNLAGREVSFKVKMNSVQKAELPEINDHFAESLGQFDNLAGLRKNIEEGLNFEKERAESQRLRKEILEKICQAADFQIPEVLIEREKEAMFEDFKRNVSENLKIPFEEYLSKIKKTEKDLLNSFEAEARKRAKSFLVLREISKREKIEALEEEIKEESGKMLGRYSNVQKAKKNLDPKKLKEYTEGAIRTEKTFAVLESFAKKN